jgi:transposase
VSLALIEDLDVRIGELTVQLKRQGADHRYIPLLVTAPGIGWINAYTIASEIGDITRFPSPAKLCGYTGLCPRVKQSGAVDARGPISKHGPNDRGDLAHAYRQPALRSGRCPVSSSRLTAHFGHAPPDEPLRFRHIPADPTGR